MMPFVFQRPVIRPCSYCFREIDDPESEAPSSLRGTPDKDWLLVKVVKMTDAEGLDDEVSFGPAPGAKIPLCCACRDGLFATLDPDVVLDYREGEKPRIISAREV